MATIEKLVEIEVLKSCPTGNPHGETVIKLSIGYFRAHDVVMRTSDRSKFIVSYNPEIERPYIYVLSLDNKILKEGDKLTFFTNIL